MQSPPMTSYCVDDGRSWASVHFAQFGGAKGGRQSSQWNISL